MPSEFTRYSIRFDGAGQILDVETVFVRRYRAVGPIRFETGPAGQGIWVPDSGYTTVGSTPICHTVEEMLEKGWIIEEDA